MKRMIRSIDFTFHPCSIRISLIGAAAVSSLLM